METFVALERLAALAQDARLSVFRLLVRTGSEGLPAGRIAEVLEIAPQSLSFHLRQLTAAGLIRCRRKGRSLIYRLHGEAMQELLSYLADNCCQGRTDLCMPVRQPDHKTLSGPLGSETAKVVLFVCTQNSARSQIAEHLLRLHGGDRFRVLSAGFMPKDVHPTTIRVLDEIGLDTSDCRAKDIGEVLGKTPIDHAIVVCEHARTRCMQMYPFAKELLHWPIEDPAACDRGDAELLDRFRAARSTLERRILDWLEKADDAEELAG